jgi:hypothetical protein
MSSILPTFNGFYLIAIALISIFSILKRFNWLGFLTFALGTDPDGDY